MQLTRGVGKKGVVINGESYIFDNICSHIGDQVIIDYPEGNDGPHTVLAAVVGGKPVVLRYTGIHADCPSCYAVDIDPEDKFCTWCAFDLRPSHFVRPCCGFSSMRPPHRYCPICGVETVLG